MSLSRRGVDKEKPPLVFGEGFHSLEEFKEWDSQKFEAKVVQYFATRLRFSTDFKKELQERFETKYLLLEQVSLACDWPVRCVCRYFSSIAKDTSLSKLLRDFTSCKFVQTYLGLVEDRGDEQPVAMVFNWPRLQTLQALVVHNITQDLSSAGTRLFWASGGNTPAQLVVEPLPAFVTFLAESGRSG